LLLSNSEDARIYLQSSYYPPVTIFLRYPKAGLCIAGLIPQSLQL